MPAVLKARMMTRRAAGGALVLVLLATVLLTRTAPTRVLRTVALSGQFVALQMDAQDSRAFITTVSTPSGAGTLYVLDTSSGALLRTVADGINPGPGNTLLDAQTRRLFVFDPQGELMRVLDARSGTLLRTVMTGYMPGGLQGGVDTRTGRLFVWASGLKVIDARSGAILRTIINVGDRIAIDERTGHVFDLEPIMHRVDMLDARTGAILRTVQLPQPPAGIVVSGANGHVFILGDTALWMLDARTGRTLRTMAVGPWRPGFDGAMTLVGDTVVIQDPSSSAIRLVDARSGHITHAIAVGSISGGPVAVGRGRRLFIAGTDCGMCPTGRVWMVDTRSGAVVRTITIGVSPSSIAVDQRAQRVVVAGWDAVKSEGRVSVLDARNGALLRYFALGANSTVPQAVGVDERLGRAVVFSPGYTTPVPDAWNWLPVWLRQRLPFIPSPQRRTRDVPASVTLLDLPR